MAPVKIPVDGAFHVLTALVMAGVVSLLAAKDQVPISPAEARTASEACFTTTTGIKVSHVAPADCPASRTVDRTVAKLFKRWNQPTGSMILGGLTVVYVRAASCPKHENDPIPVDAELPDDRSDEGSFMGCSDRDPIDPVSTVATYFATGLLKRETLMHELTHQLLARMRQLDDIDRKTLDQQRLLKDLQRKVEEQRESMEL